MNLYKVLTSAAAADVKQVLMCDILLGMISVFMPTDLNTDSCYDYCSVCVCVCVCVWCVMCDVLSSVIYFI